MKRIKAVMGRVAVSLVALAGAIALAACAIGSAEAEVIDDVFNVGGPTRVEASIDNGNIEVSADGSQGDAVRVTATVWDRERVNYHTEREGDTVKIVASVNGGAGSSGQEDRRADIRVSVPQDTELVLKTSNGSIKVSGVTGQVSASTSNGAVSVSRVSGDVEVEASNGRVELDDVTGQVKVETSNGPIGFNGTLRPGSSNSLKSSNGDVEVTLVDTAGVEVDAAASNGRVRSQLPVALSGTARDNELVGTIGDGGSRLEIRVSNGSITIK